MLLDDASLNFFCIGVLFQVCLNPRNSIRFEDLISAYMDSTIAGPASRLRVLFMAYQQL